MSLEAEVSFSYKMSPGGAHPRDGVRRSDITTAFQMAGKATGVKIYRPENNADDPETPHWNERNTKTEKYVKAWRVMKC